MFDSKTFVRVFPTMIQRGRAFRIALGVRAKVFTIVLIPSIALLCLGLSASIYLVNDGRKEKDWAEFASKTTDPAIRMIEAFQFERAASMQYTIKLDGADQQLAATRKDSDNALSSLLAAGNLDDVNRMRSEISGDLTGVHRLYQELPRLRGAIDSRVLPLDQVFTAYSRIVDTIVQGTFVAARVAPNAQSAVDLYRAVHPLRAGEAISKSVAIGTTAMTTGQLTPTQLDEFTRTVGDARGQIDYAAATLTGDMQKQMKALTDSQAWRQLVAQEDAFIRRGVVPGEDTAADDATSGRTATTRRTQNTTTAMPLTAKDWGAIAGQLRSQLLTVWKDQCAESNSNAAAAGAKKATDSLYGAIAVGAVSLLAFLAALFLANHMVGRMRRLRRQTLELADERLSGTIRALTDGTEIDATTAVPLDFGRDEIGQIADAFNRAHGAAVTVAVAEAKTRSGVNAVFLNIAHRSQAVVHRQLAVLDHAEREEEDPGKLDLLFQLDHLATRSRRNAENLIILGGQTPGRRWRQPIPLVEVVRSAIAESLDYKRIQMGRLPDTLITESAVADLIHLVAELTDNATAFSPPSTQASVSGSRVGKGVAIEVSDRGLGMSASEFAQRNALLSDPPDFTVATLSSDARLGLFVVAELAARHSISVRLTESDYGGVRAIVLIPTALTAPYT